MKNQARIIAQKQPCCEPLSWQQQLQEAVTDIATLAKLVSLPIEQLSAEAHQQFPIMVPRSFINKMQAGNPNDPLLQQILPSTKELTSPENFSSDPLQETGLNQPKGLLQKYQSRALLVLAGKCAINCRYCFRRHFPYQDNRINSDDWQNILDFLKADTQINEVIFSGGEPLLVSDNKLARYIGDLEQIPQLKRIRIHTRLPITIAQRLTDTLLTALTNTRLKTIMVLHSNHPNEIDQTLADAVAVFRQAGVHFLNQSVLLKGINDDVYTLTQLSEALFDAHILPYYLHQLDHVEGAAHFAVSEAQAIALHQQLQVNLPGFLVPKLVRELPDQPHKTLLF